MNSKSYIKRISVPIVVSIILCCLNTVSVSANSGSEILGSRYKCYIENCLTHGLITPENVSEGVNIFVSDDSFTVSKQWVFERYQYTDYYRIRYFHDGVTSYYLKLPSENDYNYLTLTELYNSYPDDCLWKIEIIGSGIYSDFCTISSKVDETKYLSINNGKVAITFGPATGRMAATQEWYLHDLDRPISHVRNTYAGGSGDGNLKPITLASTYNDTPNYGTNSYFGTYIQNGSPSTLQSCRNIGASRIIEYDGFNEKGLVEIIAEASVCVISTHGSSNSVDCQNIHLDFDGSLNTTFLNNEIPNGYLSGTECVLLSACQTAQGGSESSFAFTLHQKGVQSVVGFGENIGFVIYENGNIDPNVGDQLFTKVFLQELGEGNTVAGAVADALFYVYTNCGQTYGLESYDIIGLETLIVRQ